MPRRKNGIRLRLSVFMRTAPLLPKRVVHCRSTGARNAPVRAKASPLDRSRRRSVKLHGKGGQCKGCPEFPRDRFAHVCGIGPAPSAERRAARGHRPVRPRLHGLCCQASPRSVGSQGEPSGALTRACPAERRAAPSASFSGGLMRSLRRIWPLFLLALLPSAHGRSGPRSPLAPSTSSSSTRRSPTGTGSSTARCSGCSGTSRSSSPAARPTTRTATTSARSPVPTPAIHPPGRST